MAVMSVIADKDGPSLLVRLQDQIRRAALALEQDPPTDPSVHGARKTLKQARATLRLIRPGLERNVFARENRALRDVGRALSGSRDAAMLTATLDRLLRLCRSVDPPILSDALERRLRSALEESCAQMQATPRALLDARSTLSLVAERVRDIDLPADDREVWRKGLKRIYADGREGLERAGHERTDEHLHEWRRHAKYLWHALQALEPLSPAVVGELADQAHQLSIYLGDDHDLAVLRERITPKSLPRPDARSALLAVLDGSRRQLQDKAFLIGHRIYDDRPGTFVKRLG